MRNLGGRLQPGASFDLLRADTSIATATTVINVTLIPTTRGALTVTYTPPPTVKET